MMKILGALIALVTAFAAGAANADPAQRRGMGWTTDFSSAEVNLDEIVSGACLKTAFLPSPSWCSDRCPGSAISVLTSLSSSLNLMVSHTPIRYGF
ncbi:hypothetical protein [Pelagibacterium halotolerans]|uniref:hypothetical protein n=1 Tax=Pelagibacterium halotolerans TaxID=531813 RepID=UPI00384BCD7B